MGTSVSLAPDPFADATEPGAIERVDLGADLAVLFYADGSARFQHVCDRTATGRGVIICAPLLRLGNGHTITCRTPLTITPSILCSDCGTHGFVHTARWYSVR